MGREIFQYSKETFFVFIFAVFCFLFSSCSSRDSGVKTVVNNVPAQQTQDPITQPAQPETKELCIFVTVKDTSGQQLHIQDILRVAVVEKSGDDIPAEIVGVSLLKICPQEPKDYLVDMLLTESKNKRMFHGNFKITKEELQKNISKDVSAHEETESLAIQGPTTVTTGTQAVYFASPKESGYVHSDLYTGVSAYIFYISPKDAVKSSQIGYDALKIQTGDFGNIRLTIRCEAWSDTKGLLGYGVRTVLVTDPIFSTNSDTIPEPSNDGEDTSPAITGTVKGTLTHVNEGWYGTRFCPYTFYTVQVLNTSLSTAVSKDGTFQMDDVPFGKYTLVVIKDDREKERMEVEVTDSLTTVQLHVRC